MLLSSKLQTYAHAIKEVESTRLAIAPQASTLGLTLETAMQTLKALHTVNIADGLDPVGRMVIADSSTRQSLDQPKVCLGHHYASQTVHVEDEKIILKTRKSDRFYVQPKLVLKISKAPDASTSLEQFTQMFESAALAIEILKVPFTGTAWSFEDRVCSNGMGHQLAIGEARTLSENRKRNFSSVLNHTMFSLNRVTKQGSQLINYASGSDVVMSTISELYTVFQRQCEIDGCSPFHQDDLISLNALCPPVKVTAGEEYACVASGIDLGSIRIRFEQSSSN